MRVNDEEFHIHEKSDPRFIRREAVQTHPLPPGTEVYGVYKGDNDGYEVDGPLRAMFIALPVVSLQLASDGVLVRYQEAKFNGKTYRHERPHFPEWTDEASDLSEEMMHSLQPPLIFVQWDGDVYWQPLNDACFWNKPAAEAKANQMNELERANKKVIRQPVP